MSGDFRVIFLTAESAPSVARFRPLRNLENQSKPCSHSSYSGNIWKLRGEAPRRVEIRLRYRAVFAYSLILAFVRFRDGVAGNGDVVPPGWTCFLGVAAHIHSEMHW